MIAQIALVLRMKGPEEKDSMYRISSKIHGRTKNVVTCGEFIESIPTESEDLHMLAYCSGWGPSGTVFLY